MELFRDIPHEGIYSSHLFLREERIELPVWSSWICWWFTHYRIACYFFFFLHFLIKIYVHSVAQLCPALCDSIQCSPTGSSVHGISQARILEWVLISFSRGPSWPRDWTQIPCIGIRFFTIWATREALRWVREAKKKKVKELFLQLTSQPFTQVWIRKDEKPFLHF